MIPKINSNEDVKKTRSRKRKKLQSKEPSKNEIKSAVEEFLKKGGRITKVEPLYSDEFVENHIDHFE